MTGFAQNILAVGGFIFLLLLGLAACIRANKPPTYNVKKDGDSL